MKPKDHRAMMATMATVDDPTASDGAWQANLEATAARWAKKHGYQIDPLDAFLDYLDYLGDK